MEDNRKFLTLSRLAKTLFCLVPSSAASERNFSTFSFIHNKLRNRLKSDKVEKLVYVFDNSKSLSSKDANDDDDVVLSLNKQESDKY
jgi:hypothetical protein